MYEQSEDNVFELCFFPLFRFIGKCLLGSLVLWFYLSAFDKNPPILTDSDRIARVIVLSFYFLMGYDFSNVIRAIFIFFETFFSAFNIYLFFFSAMEGVILMIKIPFVSGYHFVRDLITVLHRFYLLITYWIDNRRKEEEYTEEELEKFANAPTIEEFLQKNNSSFEEEDDKELK